MEVFVLMGEFNYESHHVLGVYSSEEEVREAHLVFSRDHVCHYDYCYFERRVLGAPVDDRERGEYL
jgi:hypothetical protein